VLHQGGTAQAPSHHAVTQALSHFILSSAPTHLLEHLRSTHNTCLGMLDRAAASAGRLHHARCWSRGNPGGLHLGRARGGQAGAVGGLAPAEERGSQRLQRRPDALARLPLVQHHDRRVRVRVAPAQLRAGSRAPQPDRPDRGCRHGARGCQRSMTRTVLCPSRVEWALGGSDLVHACAPGGLLLTLPSRAAPPQLRAPMGSW